ncbi:hypothetical protein WMY93_014929 [Mugilogobius chulae]|uniref:Spermatogenesis-associated protein 6 N-terminal domain-containing protein n=1 Tax=Mugilogobius chulae TaxID=88201 RepID=A0AAW0P062_9GOBI
MSRKALKALVEINIRAVSCPGVRLMPCEDIYLSVRFMGQFRQSQCLPAVFPLLFLEKMTFEKIFRYAVDPGDIAVMLEYETVRIELVQLIPPIGNTLAYYANDARRFLFPEPKLVPPSSGTDQEVLMTRAQHFPGICPRLEFSTTTTIFECSAYEDIIDYPNVPMRPLTKRHRPGSSRPRTSSPQRKSSSASRRRSARGERTQSSSRPRSMSPLRARNHLSPDTERQNPASPEPELFTRPGARSASPRLTSSLTSPTLSRPPSTVRFASPEPRQSLSNVDDDLEDLQDSLQSTDLSPLQVQERVRGLLTTPKAVRRLTFGVTNAEVDDILARKSISPGPPI